MTKLLASLVVVVFLFSELRAQNLNPIRQRLGALSSQLKKNCPNQAGTASFGSLIGQSNDFREKPVYLCFNDTIPVIHNGDQDLSGDPNPNTAPGVGYAVYTCPPTIIGPDLTTIATDPCIIVSNQPAETGAPFVIAGPDTSGNTVFFNAGQIQAFFNQDEPIRLWFAPITYDSLLKTPLPGGGIGDFATYETDGAGGPAGPCVNVNIGSALSVVYLKPIEASNIHIDSGLSNCVGFFTARGGFPEFDDSASYEIEMRLDSDPNVEGVVYGSIKHNETIKFAALVPGMYTISVTDGKSCGINFKVDMSACAGVNFKLPYRTAAPGETVCLDLSLENFTDVGSAQFTLEYDNDVLLFNRIDSVGDNFVDGLFYNPIPSQGALTFSWNNAFNNITEPDGARFFQVCFDVIGAYNEESPVRFTDDPTFREVGDNFANPYGFVAQNGLIQITDDLIIAAVEPKNVSDPDLNNGSFSVRIYQGQPPYSFSWAPLGSALPYENGPIAVSKEDESVSVNGLSIGVYVLEIMDSSSPANIILDTLVINQPSVLTATKKSDALREAIKLYPNPTKGEYYIEFDRLRQEGEILIYNSAGALISERPIREKVMNMTFSNSPKGLYYAVIRIQNSIIVKKIVLE